MDRPKGQVAFPARSWLKRYHKEKLWHQISTRDAIACIEKEFPPEAYIQKYRNAVEGCMVIDTMYFELMFIQDSMYQDEL